jgi:hypothetical protein
LRYEIKKCMLWEELGRSFTPPLVGSTEGG